MKKGYQIAVLALLAITASSLPRKQRGYSRMFDSSFLPKSTNNAPIGDPHPYEEKTFN